MSRRRSVTDDSPIVFMTIFFFGQKKEKGRSEFLKPGSEAERRGFAYLAQLLRSRKKISPSIRELLADLLEPDSRSENPRRLVFAPRRRGRKAQPGLEFDIALEIADHLVAGGRLKEAIPRVVKAFEVSPSTANRAWKKHKKIMQETFGLPQKMSK
jgi:hypothetical protein